MRTTMQISKEGKMVDAGIYEIADAESFAKACREEWSALKARDMNTATSIGDLYDRMENTTERLHGMIISFANVDD